MIGKPVDDLCGGETVSGQHAGEIGLVRGPSVVREVVVLQSVLPGFQAKCIQRHISVIPSASQDFLLNFNVLAALTRQC